ncbi:hypothetical protein GCM10009555_083340 [Acrocarpospora macrocephala]|uniref:Barstar (barnase inhibitor) domain-containing protein n=1 Tax=Acrocarpospora macrocephala TaxID=150177 RepID=A0A5M3X0S4_9ACTN|nr:hypothetical protein [Acrocarpospora macrocephala]GES15347.1 hypothetical protein Amac_089440 [Acrocarpospora macrocephala]
MSYLEVLAAAPEVGGGRPYLVNQSNQSRLGELLDGLGFQVSAVRVTEDASVAELLDDIGDRLGWPHPTGGNWWGFQDYYGNIPDEGRGPYAILLENSDNLLRVGPRRFATVIHKLLSITEEIGPWPNMEIPLEFFFLGAWDADD